MKKRADLIKSSDINKNAKIENAYAQAGGKNLDTPYYSKISEIQFTCKEFHENIQGALSTSDVYVTLAMTRNTLSNNISAKAQEILNK